MQPRTARLILEALADGIDPETGEVFPAESPYQRADVVRALYVAIRALDSTETKAAKRADLPAQAGKAWDEAEDARLREGFAAQRSAAELGAAHGRTVGAIRARLVRLGLIAERAAYP